MQLRIQPSNLAMLSVLNHASSAHRIVTIVPDLAMRNIHAGARAAPRPPAAKLANFSTRATLLPAATPEAQGVQQAP